MSPSPRPASRQASPSAFLRDPDHRLVAGVTAGLGNRIGVDPLVVRIALVILTLAGGAGLLLYGVAWLVSREPTADEPVVVNDFDRQQAVAVAMVTLGLVLVLRALGIWFSDALVWPAMVAGAISAVVWIRTGPEDDDPVAGNRLFHLSPARVIVAALILFTGVVAFWIMVGPTVDVLVPLAGIFVGAALLASPLLASVWRRLQREQVQIARQQAREEVAAHLHDSVLQTLALIQRTDEPRRMVTLARTQERELRAWLYSDRDHGAPGVDLETAVEALVTQVEHDHDFDVDAVVVGNIADVDGHPHAPSLLRAVREALVNSARHAGVRTGSLYLEVEDDRISAFVRDRGVGFDPDAVPSDRHGVRHSIRDRIRRHDGRATVHSAPDEGTEVELWVPHDPAFGTDQAAGSASAGARDPAGDGDGEPSRPTRTTPPLPPAPPARPRRTTRGRADRVPPPLPPSAAMAPPPPTPPTPSATRTLRQERP